jgi:RNA methyltransferase, TrmH family
MLSSFPPLSLSQHQFLRRLQKRSERDAQRLCVLEGEHLCEELLKTYSNTKHGETTTKPSIYAVVVDAANDTPSVQRLAEDFHSLDNSVFATTSQKFAALTDTQTPQGILAVIDFPEQSFIPNAPLLVLDGLADPGNVGTMIRTAEWFGVPNVLLGAGTADRFHPKTLRATMGSVFRCAVHSTPHLADELQAHFADYRFYGASLQGAVPLEDVDFSGKVGIVMGSEARGISPDVLSVLSGTFMIEGFGAAESLNVAVATGVVLYCAARLWRAA